MKLPIRIITREIETGEVESDKIVDHDNHADRVWLSKHCYWAFRNNRSVETIPQDEFSR